RCPHLRPPRPPGGGTADPQALSRPQAVAGPGGDGLLCLYHRSPPVGGVPMPRIGGEDPRGHLRGGTEDASHCSSGPELGHWAGRGSAVLSAPRLKTVSAAHHGPPHPPGAEDLGHLSRGAAAEEPAEPDPLP